MNANPILTEQRGQIFIIKLNRPHAQNACDHETAVQMTKAIDEFDRNPELKVAIISGEGGTFCSGADLKAIARGESIFTERGGFGIMEKPPGKPVIAAVEGFAVAGGMELCLSCDLIVAANNARFGLPEVRHNLVAIGGGLFRLPKRMPYHLVMELALTADLLPAEHFHRHGVVNHLCEPGKALDSAIDLAEKIIKNGPTALVATKEIIRRSYDWTEDEAWENQMPIANIALESEDRNEGLRAFAEKRKPVWAGR